MSVVPNIFQLEKSLKINEQVEFEIKNLTPFTLAPEQ